MLMGIVMESSTIPATGLTGLAPGAHPIVTGEITPVHKCGILGHLELWGGPTGVIALAKYNFTIYENYAMTKILKEFLAIDNFPISGIIQDAVGDDINFDLQDLQKLYQTYDVNSNPINKLYYKLQCTTADGTITTPLTFKIILKTTGLE